MTPCHNNIQKRGRSSNIHHHQVTVPHPCRTMHTMQTTSRHDMIMEMGMTPMMTTWTHSPYTTMTKVLWLRMIPHHNNIPKRGGLSNIHHHREYESLSCQRRMTPWCCPTQKMPNLYLRCTQTHTISSMMSSPLQTHLSHFHTDASGSVAWVTMPCSNSCKIKMVRTVDCAPSLT